LRIRFHPLLNGILRRLRKGGSGEESAGDEDSSYGSAEHDNPPGILLSKNFATA
jgi:hypothetical protein